MRKVLVCDVDLTVVDTAFSWWKWLEVMTKANIPYSEACKYYNFSIPYKEAWEKKGCSGSPYDFWRQRHLYDDLTPMEGSVEALKAAKEYGYDIVFASAIKGDHSKSKYYFLDEHFPFKDGVLLTKEKGYIAADIVVDDRNKFLNQFTSPETLRVKIETPFDQDEELNVSLDLTMNSWYNFKQWLKDIHE